jgi:hypothetical protein
MKGTSKSIIRFNRVDDVGSLPSSHRTTSLRNMTAPFEEEEKMNFQKEEMKNIRSKIFLKKVIKQLQALIAPVRSPPEIN